METLGALQRLIGKIAILEVRIIKLENEIEELKSEDSWIVFNDQEEDLTLHGKTEPFFE